MIAIIFLSYKIMITTYHVNSYFDFNFSYHQYICNLPKELWNLLKIFFCKFTILWHLAYFSVSCDFILWNLSSILNDVMVMVYFYYYLGSLYFVYFPWTFLQFSVFSLFSIMKNSFFSDHFRRNYSWSSNVILIFVILESTLL